MKTLGKVLAMLYATVFAVVWMWSLFEVAAGNGEKQMPVLGVWLLIPGMVFAAGMLAYLVYLGWRWVFGKDPR